MVTTKMMIRLADAQLDLGRLAEAGWRRRRTSLVLVLCNKPDDGGGGDDQGGDGEGVDKGDGDYFNNQDLEIPGELEE